MSYSTEFCGCLLEMEQAAQCEAELPNYCTKTTHDLNYSPDSSTTGATLAFRSTPRKLDNTTISCPHHPVPHQHNTPNPIYQT